MLKLISHEHEKILHEHEKILHEHAKILHNHAKWSRKLSNVVVAPLISHHHAKLIFSCKMAEAHVKS